MATISLGSTPFQLPDSGSPCDLWKAYFNTLRKEVGTDHAKTIWLITWGENGSVACTTRPEFNRWLRKYDLNVSNASTRAIADLSGIGGNLLGLGKNVTRFLTIGTPLVLGGITLTILVLLVRAAQQGKARDLAALNPVGRAAWAASRLGKNNLQST